MTTQRTEKEILAELAQARAAFARSASDPETTQGAIATAAQTVKTLTKELGEYLIQGADECECKAVPMGMLKTPGYHNKGLDVPPVWEVGCVHCAPFLVEREDGNSLVIDGVTKKVKRRSFSARAYTPAEAVRKWNEKEWVEDLDFDRIPGFKPEYASE